MASDVAIKIAERMLRECFGYGNTQIEANKGIIADFLDVVGVDDAFEACQSLSIRSDVRIPEALEALRKAGMV